MILNGLIIMTIIACFSLKLIKLLYIHRNEIINLYRSCSIKFWLY